MMRSSICLSAQSRWFGLAVFILLLSVFAHAQITPLGDSYTNTAAPTTNYGTKTVLDVDGATQITYIEFDLSSIPSGYTGSNIAKASLKLYVNAVTTAGSFNVDYVNGSWSESTIDASNAPAPGATIAASVPVAKTQVHDYIIIDITPAMQAWLNGTETNNGIALVANSTFNASFDSKESTTTSQPPELDVVFTSGGTITGVETASGSGLTGGGTSGTLNLSLTTACAANQALEWSGSAWTCANVGSGTITGVTAGTDLIGGGSSGNVTLNLDTTKVPQLVGNNVFTASNPAGTTIVSENAATGIWGIGSSLGVAGSNVGSIDTPTNGGIGVVGEGTNYGAYATGGSYGIYAVGGISGTNGSYGVYAQGGSYATGGSYGVYGLGGNGSNSYGVYGGGGSFGVYSAGNFAVESGYSKSGMAVLPDDRAVLLYSVESPENWYEDFGSGKLEDGIAKIQLDPTFAQTVNTTTEYHVFLTPSGDCEGLYVAQKTPTDFEVRELHAGKSNVAFDYRIVAKQKGLESLRLEVVSTDHDRAARMRRQLAARPSHTPMLKDPTKPAEHATLLKKP